VSIPDFVAVGHLCCDIVNGARVLGGSASYASLTAHRLGRDVGVVTAAGEDFPFLETFKGISVRNIGSPSVTTFCNSYLNGIREQTVLSVATQLCPAHVPDDWAEARIAYLCPIADEVDPAVIKRFDGALIGIGAQGWLREWDEAGCVRKKRWKNAESIARLANVIVFSELDLDEPYAFAESISSLSPIVIVTQAAKGAELFLEGNRIRVPAYRTREVDPTGAGDVFAAAFLVRFDQCSDPVEAARFACCAASFVCEREGTGGIPGLGQVLERKAGYDGQSPFGPLFSWMAGTTQTKVSTRS
jgi:sugar/nucleoside kinase (ribokinase family)